MRRVAGLAQAGLHLLRPLRLPGVPVVPGGLALLALRQPRLVPIRLRWRVAGEGLGLVVARLTMGEGQGRHPGRDRRTGAVLQAVGEEHGRALRRQLGWGRNPGECARAVALANRVYGIRAHVRADGDDVVRVVTPGCPWSRREWWGREPCAAFSRYEAGLVAGLNPGVKLRYESKRTRGDPVCVGVYTWRKGER
ncbi:MAG: hypothetical protein Kow00122_11050 [Thermoleophilia bacterium]